MLIKLPYVCSILALGIVILSSSGCQTGRADKKRLLDAIDVYETAWAEGDFLLVDSFFAEDAKRLHTEPYVWDRQEIKRYFKERAAQVVVDPNKTVEKKDWRKERDYLEIRVEGNIAYDIFTTSRFKALHIWEKQRGGDWKIIYDVGMLNNPEPPQEDKK